MAELLRLRGKQIELSTIGNEHINESSPILESKLTLDVPTQDLQDAIDAFEAKKFLAFIGIEDTITSGASSSKVVTTEILAASVSGTPGGSSLASGIVTSGENNKVQIRESSTRQPVEVESGGPDVYGRITEASGVYTLSYFYDNDGTETAYTFGSDTGIDILFPESFELNALPFNCIANGVAFVDGLPAVHNHTVSELTDLTVSAVELNDVVTLSRLDDVDMGASGASIVGVGASLVNFSGTDVQGVLEDIDSKVALSSDLISTSEGFGAALVGVEAALSNFSGAQVQAALEDLDAKAVFLARLEDTTNGASGASIVGVDQTNFVTISGADLQAVLEDIDDKIGGGVPTRIESDNLTAQVDDSDPALFTVSQSVYIAGSLGVYVNGSKQIKGLQYNETLPGSGIFTFISGAIPSGTDKVEASYDYLA